MGSADDGLGIVQLPVHRQKVLPGFSKPVARQKGSTAYCIEFPDRSNDGSGIGYVRERHCCVVRQPDIQARLHVALRDAAVGAAAIAELTHGLCGRSTFERGWSSAERPSRPPPIRGRSRSWTRTLRVIALADIALAANNAIGMGHVPADKLVWLDTDGRIIDGTVEWR